MSTANIIPAGQASLTASAGESPIPWGIPEWFIISQSVLPALLYLPGMQEYRLWIRIAPFLACLLPLVMIPHWRMRPHPARPFLFAFLAWIAIIGCFHPHTNTLLAGIAQVGIYLAVIAPLIWVPAVMRGTRHLQRILIILLIINGIDSTVGVLQVYDPDRWLPSDYSTIVTQSKFGLSGLTYEVGDGRKIIRPPGLSDTPGAVAVAGMIATLLGTTLLFQRVHPSLKIAAGGFGVMGLGAIFFSQVRAALLILTVAGIVYAVLLLRQKSFGKAAGLITAALILGTIGCLLVLQLAGASVLERFASLANPLEAFEASERGPMLRHSFSTLLSEHPLGAGLGRWGMMRVYFGDESNVLSPQIWAEIQIAAWILDGGLIAMVLYMTAIVVTLFQQARIAVKAKNRELMVWSVPVIALTVAILPSILSYCPFVSQMGVQYWFFVGALFGSWIQEEGEPS